MEKKRFKEPNWYIRLEITSFNTPQAVFMLMEEARSLGLSMEILGSVRSLGKTIARDAGDTFIIQVGSHDKLHACVALRTLYESETIVFPQEMKDNLQRQIDEVMDVAVLDFELGLG